MDFITTMMDEFVKDNAWYWFLAVALCVILIFVEGLIKLIKREINGRRLRTKE